MANEFTPKQLNITPALGREKAEVRLTVHGDSMASEGNIAIKQAWYLVQHTDVTGRMNGEGAIAYRRLSGYQLAKMVCEIANQNIMGADVTAYMYKFLGISLEVAAVAEPTYLIANNVMDTDPIEHETKAEVIDDLRERAAIGEQLHGYQVLMMRGTELVESLRADNWLAWYDKTRRPHADIATSTPETVTSEPAPDVASEQGSALADSKPVKFADIVESVAQYAFETDAYEMQYVDCINHIMGDDYYGNLATSLKQTRLFNAVYKRVDELWTESIDKKNNPAHDVAAQADVADTRAAIKARLLSKYDDNEYEAELKSLRGKAIDFSDATDAAIPVSSDAISNTAIPVADAELPFAEFDSEPATLLTDEILMASRAAANQRTETLYADTRKVSGHGRTSRNRRKNAPQLSYTARGKAQQGRKVSSTMNIERNAAKQAKLRQEYASRERVGIVRRNRPVGIPNKVISIQHQLAVLDAIFGKVA